MAKIFLPSSSGNVIISSNNDEGRILKSCYKVTELINFLFIKKKLIFCFVVVKEMGLLL